MKKYQVIDEQTNVESISFELEFAKFMRNPDYKRTAECLDRILEKERGRIDTSLFGNKIFINTIGRKRLAPEIVKRFKHLLGERDLKNTESKTLIKDEVQSWLQSIEQETDTPTPNQYADFVLVKARDQFEPMTREQWGDDTDYEVYYRNTAHVFSERLEAVEEWAKMKREQPAETFILPPELDTPEARKYFDRAIEQGLMSEDYKWLKGLQMLACFARDFSMKLSLGKGNRISWKPFESLFEIEPGKLRLNYNDIQKTGQNPSESDLIDKVFE